MNEHAPTQRGIFTRIAGAVRAFFASWNAPLPEFGRMTLREFLDRGEAFLEEKKIDADAWVMNRAIVDAIIEHDPSVDLDRSVIVLWDTTMWVDLGKVARPWATEPSIDVVGSRPYSIGSSLYPPGIEIGPLNPDATDPKDRYPGQKATAEIEFPVEAFSRERTLEAMREMLTKFDAAMSEKEVRP